jgi:hypothetical protein
MKALEIVKNVLNQILYQDVEFQHALRQAFKDHPKIKSIPASSPPSSAASFVITTSFSAS